MTAPCEQCTSQLLAQLPIEAIGQQESQSMIPAVSSALTTVTPAQAQQTGRKVEIEPAPEGVHLS
jgi:hypothetical protein